VLGVGALVILLSLVNSYLFTLNAYSESLNAISEIQLVLDTCTVSHMHGGASSSTTSTGYWLNLTGFSFYIHVQGVFVLI
jgi:hypothetical protein